MCVCVHEFHQHKSSEHEQHQVSSSEPLKQMKSYANVHGIRENTTEQVTHASVHSRRKLKSLQSIIEMKNEKVSEQYSHARQDLQLNAS